MIDGHFDTSAEDHESLRDIPESRLDHLEASRRGLGEHALLLAHTAHLITDVLENPDGQVGGLHVASVPRSAGSREPARETCDAAARCPASGP